MVSPTTVGVKVIRKGQPVELRATLTQRGAQVSAVAAAHGTGGSEPMKIGAGVPYTKTFDGEKHFKDVRQLTFDLGSAVGEAVVQRGAARRQLEQQQHDDC